MLLERDHELELLVGLLDEVSTSGGRVVLVRGEAGIGKTALVREFVNLIADRAHVHVGWCDDLSTPQPLGPFLDVARSESELAEALAAGDLGAVLDGLVGLLSTHLRPAVLVIEDTQWADEATLDAIQYLGRRIEQTNGLLVLTYREGEVDYEHPLRFVIGEIPPGVLERVHLEPLSADAVSAMSSGKDVDLRQLMELTDGNPLFVTEMLAFGSESVPQSVHDSVLARASKLSAEAREALDLISVVPGDTERWIIESVFVRIEEPLAEGMRQGLIEVGEVTVSFHHELSRRAVESVLRPEQKRRLNRQVLELLEGRESPDPARLVHHAREASDTDAIVRYAPKAARAAIAVEGHREAVEHFETLESHLDQVEPVERAAIFEDRARSEYLLGNFPRAISTLGKATDLYEAIGDNVARARTLTFATRLHELSLDPEAADRCLDVAIRILEAMPPTQELAFAMSQRAWVLMMRGDDRRASEVADRAIGLARGTGAERALINALNTKGAVRYRQGDPEGMEALEEARGLAVRCGDAHEEIRALHNMSSVALRQRELSLAHELALRTIEVEKKHRFPAFGGSSDLAFVLVRQGDWTAAEKLAVEVLETIHPDEPKVRWEMALVLGRLETRYGRSHARSTLERTWSQERKARQLQFSTHFAACLAECMWVTGDVDPRHIKDFRQLLDEVLRLGNIWDTGELALWLWKLGELSEVPEEIAEPYRLIMTGDPLKAARIWEERGYPYERAIALSHGNAEARLEALGILEDLGATAVADKLRLELREQGVSVPRRAGRQLRQAGLTARQSEVLGLLAEGMSNIEIADRLFLSPRTVEHHVAAIMSKLNVPTRREAVISAEEQGLLTIR